MTRIAAHRAAAGLSQQDVAERMMAAAAAQGRAGVAVAANTVSRWERGRAVPIPLYRRLLAEVLDVTVDDLGLSLPAGGQADDDEDEFGEPFADDPDPRVLRSQDEWRRTRRHLNARRHALAQVAAGLYPPEYRLGSTGLLAHPDWLPARPVDLAAIALVHDPIAAGPQLHGTEAETSAVRPRQTLVRRYPRYTQAIRDLAHPRLFENRLCWRITGASFDDDGARMDFAESQYFAGVDVMEAAAHELAYVALDPDGRPCPEVPTLRDLPFRRLIGDPFDTGRRPLLAAISTLTIRRDGDDASFLLHRRDPRSVAIAGGMLQVIPSGIFQPSSVLPAAMRADFDLWRNIMREISEELLGNAEADGHGQPADYDREPFCTLDDARRDGRLRVCALGIAVDALSLFGEILTVAVWDADVFDALAADFVTRNDEGSVMTKRIPFTAEGVASVLGSGRLAPAGAGCVELAWQHRAHILGERAAVGG